MHKLTISLIVVLVAFFTSARAEDLTMLSSTDNLITYAVEQSAVASAGVSASLPTSNTNGYAQTLLKSSTVKEITNSIHAFALGVKVVNPKDSLFGWGQIMNSDYETLFWGYNQFYLVFSEKGGAGYSLPPDYGDFDLRLVDNVPIKIPGAEGAMITFVDAYGRSQSSYSITAQHGTVYYPRQLAGTNAMLSVYITSKDGMVGDWKTWDVKNNGAEVAPLYFNIAFDSGIVGMVPLTDTSVYVAVPTNAKGVGTNLSVEFTATGKEIINVSFWTTGGGVNGKWFLGANVRKAGSTKSIWYPGVAGGKSVSFLLTVDPGVIYITPAWSNGDLVVPFDPWYPPYYGGEKGGGVAVTTTSEEPKG